MSGIGQTGGTFVYAQDDPYIHLTLARTLAQSGVWGIRPDEFAGASSSPLWTVLLAALQRAGAVADWWPLVVNLAAGIGVLLVLAWIIEREGLRRFAIPLLLAVVLVTPLPTLALIGLEHTLFVLLALAFCWRVARHVADAEPTGMLATCLLGGALVATRYEGLFLIVGAAGLLLSRRRFTLVVALTVAAAIPIVAYAAFSLAHGGPVLPNSVLMKSGPARFATVGSGLSAVLADWFAVTQLFARPPQLVLTLSVLLALSATAGRITPGDRRARAFATLFVVTSLLHACLVKMEWFFRYEAYVIALGLLALALLVLPAGADLLSRGRRRSDAAATALVILLALPLAIRALSALAVTPGAMRNVYQQQYQMALFFRDAYPMDTIALNDIGAVSWVAPSPIVDVMGLASSQIADLKRHRRFNRETLAAVMLRSNVKAIAMYEKVFAPVIPRSWQLVAEWRIPENVGVSEDTVGFYAPTAADAARLRQALDTFRPRLPLAVEYRRLDDDDRRSPAGLRP